MPEAELGLFRAEGRMAAVKAQGVSAGDVVVPGIVAVAAFGHEVGHTAYQVENLLIWGDVVHVPSAQFADPGLTWSFDTDPSAAHQTRLHLFDCAVRERLWVAGAHLDFPGIGRVVADGAGYGFVSLE